MRFLYAVILSCLSLQSFSQNRVENQQFLNSIYESIRSKADIAIIGMSGGADSTLVATLCQQALGKENVISLHMPYGETDYRFFNSRSVKTADFLNIQKHVISIQKSVDQLEESLKIIGNLDQINHGNLRARVRTNLLYATGHHIGSETQKRVRVMGTGNMSEDYIGYDTKGGDALADYFPIQ